MKKILCGALVLLAAVAGFTSCKKKTDTQSITSITLSAESMKITPGQSGRLYAKSDNGEQGTYTWVSSNTDVLTVDTKGNYNAITYGEATIVCTEAGGATAACAFKVVTKLETFDFQGASVTVPEVKDSTLYVLGTIIATGDTVYAYLAETTVKIYSKGFGINDEGEYTGEDTVVIVSLPTHVLYADNTTAPQLCKPGEHYTAVTGTYKFGNGLDEHSILAGSIIDTVYIPLMTQAFDAYNQGDLNTFFDKRDEAADKGFKGATATYLYKTEGGYAQAVMPCALVKAGNVKISTNENSLYMYNTEGAMMLTPMGGTYEFGMDITADEEMGTITVNSNKLVLGNDLRFSLLSY